MNFLMTIFGRSRLIVALLIGMVSFSASAQSTTSTLLSCRLSSDPNGPFALINNQPAVILGSFLRNVFIPSKDPAFTGLALQTNFGGSNDVPSEFSQRRGPGGLYNHWEMNLALNNEIVPESVKGINSEFFDFPRPDRWLILTFKIQKYEIRAECRAIEIREY